MSIQTDADLDFMLEDAGVPVSLGASNTFGILRRTDTIETDDVAGFITVKHQVLTIRDGTLPGIADDVSITIDSTVYRVRKVLDVVARLVRISVTS